MSTTAIVGRARLGVGPQRDAEPMVMTALLVAVALLLGALTSIKPTLALGVVACALITVLVVRAPVAHLLLVLVVTAVVPLIIQSAYGTGGNAKAAGAIPSDALVIIGLLRAMIVLRHQPLDRHSTLTVVLTIAFLGAATMALINAMSLGRSLSGVGSEFRVLLGFSTVLMALPMLADEARRRRLLAGLVVLGLAIGVWGVAQFALHLKFDAPSDLGASSTQSFDTAGRVVGLYAFPVAAVTAVAVLSAGVVRHRAWRATLVGVLGLNLAATVLTFERTFFVATLAGFGAVLVLGNWRQRARLATWAPASFGALFLVLLALAPTVLSAYVAHLSTLRNSTTDSSVTYRVAESRLVTEQINQRPLTGSGLGAYILIGRPGTNQVVAARPYAENGYLWLAWKLGIPGASLLWLLIIQAVFGRARREEDPTLLATRVGAQASLVALALATVAFPSFNQLAITPIMGVLLALCAAPRLTSRACSGATA